MSRVVVGAFVLCGFGTHIAETERGKERERDTNTSKESVCVCAHLYLENLYFDHQ